MTVDLLLSALLRLTLLSSAALLLLAALRPGLRALLGARATYTAWLLVPLLLASPWLPAPPLPTLPLASQAAPTLLTAPADALRQALPLRPPAPADAVQPTAPWPVLLLWCAGALCLATAQWHGQRRYRQQLEQGADGHWRAPAGHSPAVMGVWPAQLVLPVDFEQRFDRDSQRLMLAHEAIHLRRHDTAWNLLAAGLLCLQWFNPLAWWGWQRLRVDQELACDEAVLDATPDARLRSAYGRALLAAHEGPAHPVLASSWSTRHPLVQRLQRLAGHRAASRARRKAGALLVLGLGLGAALLARAAQEPPVAPPAAQRAAQGLALHIESQVAQEGWQHSEMRLPLPRPAPGASPTGLTVQQMQPGWCLHLMLYAFGDGEVRPMATAMDETCQRPLTEGRSLSPDGRVAQFSAQTPQGALQVQVTARWMQAAEVARAREADASAPAPLSPAQRQALQRQREASTASDQALAAQDRAWRAARAPQPGTR